ncbi:hypothetical protein ACS0TY_018872 [Phlomoides rotata]
MQHGFGFAFEVELATDFSTVEIAFDKHWLHLWLETDSVYVIVVSHIFREGNASADRLTREPVDGFEWWGTVPDFLIPFLNRDRSVKFYCFSM